MFRPAEQGRFVQRFAPMGENLRQTMRRNSNEFNARLVTVGVSHRSLDLIHLILAVPK